MRTFFEFNELKWDQKTIRTVFDVVEDVMNGLPITKEDQCLLAKKNINKNQISKFGKKVRSKTKPLHPAIFLDNNKIISDNSMCLFVSLPDRHRRKISL